jgi:hypothetical protein
MGYKNLCFMAQKGAAAKQRKAFALCVLPQGITDRREVIPMGYKNVCFMAQKSAAAKQRKAFALCINLPKGSPTAGSRS